jgi:hypothetical protein
LDVFVESAEEAILLVSVLDIFEEVVSEFIELELEELPLQAEKKIALININEAEMNFFI